jgi:hypothetical protein
MHNHYLTIQQLPIWLVFFVYQGSKLVNKQEHRGLIVRKKTELSTLVKQGSNNQNLICEARNACKARNKGQWKQERKAIQPERVGCRAHRRGKACLRQNDNAH